MSRRDGQFRWRLAVTAARTVMAVAAAFAGAAPLPIPALAQSEQGGGIGIVRDAETEALLQDYLKPIFKAAGVRAGQVQVFIVPDDSFNAFVADPTHLFVNVGAIVQSDTPNELIGVLAHETGHIVHQDTAKLQQEVHDLQSLALIGSLLGIGAAVAGGISGSQGAATAGQGLTSLAPTLAERSLLSYRRAQESAADRSAVDFLNASGQSPKGLLTTLQTLSSQNLLLEANADPYLQDHPLSADRIAALQDLVNASPYVNKKDSPDLQLRHDLVRAKLVGFTWTSGRVQTRYPLSDTSLPAQYARAISAYRFGPLAPAQKQIDALIAAKPDDPYFLELKGQELLETGSPTASLDPLRKAVALAPDAGLIKILLGQALMSANAKGNAQEAITVLTSGLQSDPDDSNGYRALARAYDQTGNEPLAQLATAEGLFTDGDIDGAKIQAQRAQDKLPVGSPPRLRADDIVSFKPPKS